MMLMDQLPANFEVHRATADLNLQSLTIWTTPTTFTIIPNITRSRIPTILQINRATKTIKQLKSDGSFQKDQTAKPLSFSCLIGIIDLGGKKIVMLGEQVTIVGSINQRDIFRITKPVFLFYDLTEKAQLTETQAGMLLNITSIFEQGMYFSFSYDLALRLNALKAPQSERRKFNWAYNFQSELRQFDSMWRLSIIQGFVGRIQLHITGMKLFLMLISRRAIDRGGTQAYARGIDLAGNAGNYVQTEQILITQEYYFSFVQSRGTVPLFWHSETSNYGFNSIKIDAGKDSAMVGFKKHIGILKERGQFNEILLLNLLYAQNQQKKLIQNYEYIVKRTIQQNTLKQFDITLRYAYFDIHTNCSNKQYSPLDEFLQSKLATLIESYGFYALKIDNSNKQITILNNQTGLMRLNCFNCIDRSNIAQSRIAAIKLINILKFLGIEINEFKNGLTFLSTDSPFSNLYRNLWADNGDALSKQYTGTGSTQSYAFRKGKLSYLTTLDHGIKSLFRAVRNIRNQDQQKNQAVQFIVGSNTSLVKRKNSKQLTNNIEMEQMSAMKFKKQENSTADQKEYNYKKLEQKK